MSLKTRVQKFFAPLTSNTGGSFLSSWKNGTNDANLLRSYQGYVYACVSAIAEEVAMIDFVVNQEMTDGSLKEQPMNSFLKALDNPNPLMSKYQLIELTQTHIELTGEAFWYMEIGEDTGKPKSFYLLPPERMAVVIDKNSSLPRVAGYVFTKQDGTQVPLDKEEVEHFKMPNPWDPYRGYGTVEAGMAYILTEKFGAEYTKNYIYNNAMPAGIISIKQTMDKPNFDELKRQWKQEYGTIDKAGKTAFINGTEVTFTKVGSSLSESAMTELKSMTRDDIMTMFRVSKPILGIFEDVNLASAKTAQYVFMSRVIDPKMKRMTDTLQDLMNRWNSKTQKYVLSYRSPVPEDVDDKLKVYEAGLNKWLTIDEIRAKEGLEAVDGGNVLQVPLNLIPLGNPPAKDPNSKSIRIKRTVTTTVKKKSVDQKTQRYIAELNANTEQWTKKFKKELDSILTAQRDQILANWKIIEPKALDEFKFNDTEFNSDFVDHLTPLEYELMKQQGAVALAYVGETELEFQVNERVTKSVSDRMRRIATDFNTETKQALEKTLLEGITNNETVSQIKGRVKSYFDDTAKGYRAERVARTETLNATNVGTVESYKQIGYVTKLTWLADSNACQFCSELDGQTISIEQSFAEEGTTLTGANGGILNVDFGSIDNPPAHPNCECSILPVIE